MNIFPHLLEPINVNSVTLKNRIVAAPVEGIGVTKNDDIERFAILAKGGSSVVTIGSVCIDNERSQFITRLVYLGKVDAFYLSEAAYAIRQYGGIPSVELFHAGQWGNYFPENKLGSIDLVRDDGVVVEAMTEAQMKHVAENYAKAAAFARNIGFGMVQLHYAHGWLPAQFLSPYFNKRSDKYGGSFENRARFPFMIVEEVRNAVGEDFPIEMRISGSEVVEGGIEISEVVRFIQMIEDRIDLVHVSVGMDKVPAAQVRMLPTAYSPHAPNIELSATIKSKVNIPVITVGGINDPYLAESIIADGKADIVALGRALIADPEFPNKTREGRVEEITPCIRCTSCFTDYVVKKNVSCTVNPRFTREQRLDYEYRHIPIPKKVLVIGGGPAGMKAAITAADRGHSVTLVEKREKLGGSLLYSDYSDIRVDLRNFKDYLIRRLENLGVKTLLGTSASEELISDLEPDTVIAAVGSELIKPAIEGIEKENVFSVKDMYFHLDKIGKKVAVIGSGEIGCEAGLLLARSGHEVSIIDEKNTVALNANFINRQALLLEMDKHNNLHIFTNTHCAEIRPEFIKVKETEKTIPVDSVVYATGFQSNNDAFSNFVAFPDRIIFIGDCCSPRGIQNAIREGYHAGMQI